MRAPRARARTLHAAVEPLLQLGALLVGVAPVVRRSGIFLREGQGDRRPGARDEWTLRFEQMKVSFSERAVSRGSVLRGELSGRRGARAGAPDNVAAGTLDRVQQLGRAAVDLNLHQRGQFVLAAAADVDAVGRAHLNGALDKGLDLRRVMSAPRTPTPAPWPAARPRAASARPASASWNLGR